jgi:acyl-CoA dehydrogenase
MMELMLIFLCTAVGLGLAIKRAPLWTWTLAVVGIILATQIGGLKGNIREPSFGMLSVCAWLVALVFGALSIPSFRRRILVTPIYHMIRRGLPRVSDTARLALEAGTVGFESGFLAGRPDWQELRSIPPMALSQEETAFFNGPTDTLCGMIDDWDIRHNRREIPEAIWSFVKKHGFLCLRLSKQYGGRGFSAQALSLILGKIAARSPDIFGILMIPNSLGLAELIETYGTDAQKGHFLPRLASGEDIPCLALTGPASGSDAATMRDIGTVTRGTYAGADTIGIRASWDKRYITLAPDATLIGIALQVFDPENVLGRGDTLGMTVAIVPARHPGVHVGRRHLPCGAAFSNGPTRGEDVFIPLAWVIGGEAMVGRGWWMITECLATSRAIALPGCAAAGTKAMLRVSTAYGHIRRQFGFPIAKMEGLEEPLARMAETAYVNEACRAVIAAMVDRGEKPSALSALVKYQTTERLRRSVNDAMDLHGGRAIFDGPANYIQSIYQMVPAAITIEGANIVTRGLIAFTQGAFRSHPYLWKEIKACQDDNERRGLAAFENAFLAHISFSLSNLSSALVHNITGGRFCAVPDQPFDADRWYRQLSRASRNFALVADLAVIALARKIRTKQKLTGRLADALSELFLLACVLKRYEDDGRPGDDSQFVAFAMQNGLHRFQEAIRGTIENFPIMWLRLLMRVAVFPLGFPYRPAPDRLGQKIARLASGPGETRDRLTRHIYVSNDPLDPTGLLEVTLEKVIKAEEIQKKVERAARRGLIRRFHGIDWIGDAVSRNIITQQEGNLLRDAETSTARVVAVDDFDPDEVRPHYMTAGHNFRAVREAARE